jgi:peptidoglycan-N-acetylglucosamine deacetylase
MRRRHRLLLLVLTLALSLTARAAAAKPLLVGFYLPWDAASRASVTSHAGALDVLAPMSGALDSAAGTVRWQSDPALAPALAATRAKPRVFPVVSNAHDQVWDTPAADGALLDPEAGDAFIGALTAQAGAQGWGGYILDFENLSPKAAPAYAPFLARLRAALKPLGMELWVTTGVAADPALVQQLAAATDAVVLMAYDQCWATSTPGPIAAQDWLQASLDAKLAHADPAHYVVALGAYGYDWPDGQRAGVVSAADAAQLAMTAGKPVTREPPAANPHFTYAAADGHAHAVWYLDAPAFKAQRAAAEALHARGVAIWRLGLEDPALWTKTAPSHAAGPTAPAPYPACVTLKPAP